MGGRNGWRIRSKAGRCREGIGQEAGREPCRVGETVEQAEILVFVGVRELVSCKTEEAGKERWNIQESFSVYSRNYRENDA